MPQVQSVDSLEIADRVSKTQRTGRLESLLPYVPLGVGGVWSGWNFVVCVGGAA